MAITEKETWIVENFYFGNPVTPSDRTWRYRGTTYQVQVWWAVPTPEDAQEWIDELIAANPGQIFEPEMSEDLTATNHLHYWRVRAWYQPEEGVAMRDYMEDKRSAWL